MGGGILMAMYKDLDGNIWDNMDGIAPIPQGAVLMTDVELEAFKNPPKTQEQLDVEAKQAKQAMLDTITITTTSGKVFDGREKDIPLMSGAINVSSILGVTSTQWKLHDNSVAIITLDELKEALALSMQAIGAIKVS